MITASVFRNGANRAIRIPKALEFDAEHVHIERDGHRLVITPIASPKKSWAAFFGKPGAGAGFMRQRKTHSPAERISLD